MNCQRPLFGSIERLAKFLDDCPHRKPIRVGAFNTAERWSEDVSADVTEELRRRCDLQMRDLPPAISDFVERHEMPDGRQLSLRLV
jgi:hypothetical protein